MLDLLRRQPCLTSQIKSDMFVTEPLEFIGVVDASPVADMRLSRLRGVPRLAHHALHNKSTSEQNHG